MHANSSQQALAKPYPTLSMRPPTRSPRAVSIAILVGVIMVFIFGYEIGQLSMISQSNHGLLRRPSLFQSTTIECTMPYDAYEAELYSAAQCQKQAQIFSNYYCPSDIVVVVITSENTKERMDRCGHTWMHDLYAAGFHVLPVAAAPIPSLPQVHSLGLPQQHSNQIRELTIRSMQLARRRFPQAKWYMKVDDDAYLYSGNLIARLNMFMDGREHVNASKPIALGSKPSDKLPMLMGGAGWIQSQPALDLALPAMMDPHEACGRSTAEDVAWSDCWQKYGVSKLDLPGLIPVQNTLAWTMWHWMLGKNGPPKLPITYHWIKDDASMYELHNCKRKFPIALVDRTVDELPAW